MLPTDSDLIGAGGLPVGTSFALSSFHCEWVEERSRSKRERAEYCESCGPDCSLRPFWSAACRLPRPWRSKVRFPSIMKNALCTIGTRRRTSPRSQTRQNWGRRFRQIGSIQNSFHRPPQSRRRCCRASSRDRPLAGCSRASNRACQRCWYAFTLTSSGAFILFPVAAAWRTTGELAAHDARNTSSARPSTSIFPAFPKGGWRDISDACPAAAVSEPTAARPTCILMSGRGGSGTGPAANVRSPAPVGAMLQRLPPGMRMRTHPSAVAATRGQAALRRLVLSFSSSRTTFRERHFFNSARIVLLSDQQLAEHYLIR